MKIPIPDRQDAQDLTSEVFQQALANLGRFEWRGVPFAAWLYRIAANAVADHFKKKSRETGVPADDLPSDADADIEQRALLFRSVDRLPPDQRNVIVMRFAEGKSIREIADELGKSEGAIKQLQWRGLQSLRTQMNQSHA